MSFHQHCSLKHTIGQSQGEGVQLFYSFKITTTSIILYCPRPVSLCLDFFSVPPFFFFFFCDASFSFSTKIQIFYLSTYSSLHFVPYLSLLFLLSFSYHDIDHLKSIHIVFFCPPSFVFSSVFLLHAHLDVKGIWLVILQSVQEHAHIRWHRVTPVQCKNLCWCDQCRSCYWQTAIFPR